MNKNISTIHYKFRQAIPLFKHLSDDLYYQLDLSGFYFPTGKIETMRNYLENKLGHFIVSYKEDVFDLSKPIETHLCARLKGADLTKTQKDLLFFFERISKQQKVTFVVYSKPTVLIKPSESAIFALYKNHK